MKDKIEYINFMMWLQSDTAHLNYDPVEASEKYLEFRATPQPEQQGKDVCVHERYLNGKCSLCYEKLEPTEPEEAKEWQNLLALDMADFYLEIYASRDTFSRAKIMEMFRDYYNVKMSNIKEVMQEKLDESKLLLSKAKEGTNAYSLGWHRGNLSVLTELLKTL